MPLDTAKSNTDTAIRDSELPSFITTSWVDDDMIITIQKLGISQIVLRYHQQDDDVLVSENNRKVAPFHKPYVTIVEDKITEIIFKAGAEKY